MRTIKVVLHDDESAQVTPEKVYMGEHRAARLEVTLPQRMREGFDYYNLCFDVMGTGKRVPLGNIYMAADETQGEQQETAGIAWMADGKIICELPESLTQSSYVRVQAEACCEAEGTCTRLEKSVPFVIRFADSIAGQGDALSALALGHMNELMAQLHRMKHTLRAQQEDAKNVLLEAVAQAEQTLLDIGEQVQQQTQALVQTKVDAAVGAAVEASVSAALPAAVGTAVDTAVTAAVSTALANISSDISTAVSASGDQLMGWWEDGLQAALSGVCVEHIEAGAGDTLCTLSPGVRYHITFAQGAQSLALTLDDTEASSGFAQEFMLAIALPAQDCPQIETAYLSERSLLFPADFVWQPGHVTELHVLDGFAAASCWEAVP